MSLVSFVKADESDVTKLKQSMLKALNLISYSFQSNIRNIVIKPNMCYYWDYTTGQTTDPKFIAALIELLREEINPDINISIVESDASAMKCKYAFKILGYEKLAEKYNISLVNLSNDKKEKTEISVGKYTFNFEVPQIIIILFQINISIIQNSMRL